MIVVRYLSTTLAENFIILIAISSGIATLIALGNLTILNILFISSLKARGESKLTELGKMF